MSSRTDPNNRPVPVKKILKALINQKGPPTVRWILTKQASQKLQEVHETTHIDKDILTDCAINALHAALSGNGNPIKVRDSRLRAWLNRPDSES